MRQVFVYQEDNKYKIIDKATDKLFYEIDDVLLFNATYKRYKGKKGWNGILSEEVNLNLVEELEHNFYPLVFIDKEYYPRWYYNLSDPVKHVRTLKLKDNKLMAVGGKWKDYRIYQLCKPWESQVIEWGTEVTATDNQDIINRLYSHYRVSTTVNIATGTSG